MTREQRQMEIWLMKREWKQFVTEFKSGLARWAKAASYAINR